MIDDASYAIGLTGSICTGKSASEKFLSNFFPVLDADQVVHDLYSTDVDLIDQIASKFGSQIIDSGVIDRKALGKIVFSSRERLNELVSIVHPKVTELILQKIEECKSRKNVSIFSIPLLFENSWQSSLDQTIVITCNEETQIARIQARDNKSRDEALQVIKTQMTQQEKISHADFVVSNDDDLSQLHLKLKRLFPQAN